MSRLTGPDLAGYIPGMNATGERSRGHWGGELILKADDGTFIANIVYWQTGWISYGMPAMEEVLNNSLTRYVINETDHDIQLLGQ